MLEVRHLKRVYKVKGASPVYALNDVSLKFPETGLVFILGKSGSGKSTLLNVMGGLDVADEGEIIINNKSSKDFSKGEMDSYRNTYLGFIFQEYNILSDFTVKENIALALQLQHKKASDEEIDKILEEVDLVGLGKRKPNELSGGQKQRVAIARALVKEPKIIFGDEPTGALDSNTGKQVFETLKKLSKDKLVIIVSHDRDFAEHFGDRVIELKDGVVISDISKTTSKEVESFNDLYLVGDNIIRLNKNRPLVAEDLPFINKAIAKADGDVFISADTHVNNSLCEVAKISLDGGQEEFRNTDPSLIKASDEKFNPIKSSFSLTHAVKMGFRSLKVKPFRLAMTILLSTVAFSLFGASLTLSLFSVKDAVHETVVNNNVSNVTFSLRSKNNLAVNVDEEKVKEIEEKSGAKVYTADKFVSSLYTVDTVNDLFHVKTLNSKIAISDTFLEDCNFSLISGKLPSSDDECAISLYAYYTYKDFGLSSSKGSIPSSDVTYDDVIGTTIEDTSSSSSSGNNKYKIVGIIDTKLPERLLAYRYDTSNVSYDDPNYGELNFLSVGSIPTFHTSVYLLNAASQKKDITISYPLTNDSGDYFYLGHYYSSEDITCFFDSSKSIIATGEATISPLHLKDYLDRHLGESETYPEGSFRYALNGIIKMTETYKDTFIDENYSSIYDKYKDDEEFPQSISSHRGACYEFIFNTVDGQNTPEYKQYLTELVSKAKTSLSSVSETINIPIVSGSLPTGEKDDNGIVKDETYSFRIVGLDLSESVNFNISEEDAKEIVTKFAENNSYSDSLNNFGILYFGEDASKMDKFMDFYQERRAIIEDDKALKTEWYIGISHPTISSVISSAYVIATLTQVFFYIGIAMAVFSMLLFYNFISVSINNKKHEIGILRAVGAKRSDVFKIFFSEAFIIALMNFALSVIVVFAASFAVNANLEKNASLTFSVMSPNIIVVLALLGISIVASIISSILPVAKLANKKPIDAIQNR